MACSSQTGQVSPKPRAYPYVDFPNKTYRAYHSPACPITFMYPEYAEINQTKPSDTLPGVQCWFNVYYPQFKATVHCSYNAIADNTQFETMVEDAFEIADQVNKRSNFTNEQVVQLPNGSAALIFDFEGPAASPIQFFVTDSLNHFFKGSLYYQVAHHPDSLGIITQFIKQDIHQMMSTFQWK